MVKNKYYPLSRKIAPYILFGAEIIVFIQVILRHNAVANDFFGLQLSLLICSIIMTGSLFLSMTRTYRRSAAIFFFLGVQASILSGSWDVTFPENTIVWTWCVVAMLLSGIGLFLDAEEQQLKPRNRL